MSLLVLSPMPPEAPLYSNEKPYKSLISLELHFPENNPTSFPNKTLISQQRHIIHWRQCDVRNCSYGHPKMEDADSGKN